MRRSLPGSSLRRRRRHADNDVLGRVSREAPPLNFAIVLVGSRAFLVLAIETAIDLSLMDGLNPLIDFVLLLLHLILVDLTLKSAECCFSIAALAIITERVEDGVDLPRLKRTLNSRRLIILGVDFRG